MVSIRKLKTFIKKTDEKESQGETVSLEQMPCRRIIKNPTPEYYIDGRKVTPILIEKF